MGKNPDLLLAVEKSFLGHIMNPGQELKKSNALREVGCLMYY